MRPVFDTYTFEGAERLRKTILAYWAARGRKPVVFLRRVINSVDGGTVFVVDSNMVGGQPRW